ncbi:MAG: biotin/lipoyl-binding protein [Syntrophobacteraceae bacterium]
MRTKLLIVLAVAGIVAGIVNAHFSASSKPPLPPAFPPAENPYAKGIYAEGIIESFQPNGENINIFPEVPGTVTNILVDEGAPVSKGTPLLVIDNSIQKATVAQQKVASEAALALLRELKAQPRKEVLAVSKAQVVAAAASLKTARDDLAIVQKAFELDPQSVSKQQLTDAINAEKVAEGNLGIAQKNYELTKAGAWIYDIENQQHLYESLVKTYESGKALLAKYIIRAPVDGTILSINAAKGSFVSTTGIYETYSQVYAPVIVMGGAEPTYQVRCFVDEILVPRLPTLSQMNTRMYLRGTDISIPLEFVRVAPYVIPKVELSNQRTERVDVRDLAVLFRFEPPKGLHVYPGILVDVYLQVQNGEQPNSKPSE